MSNFILKPLVQKIANLTVFLLMPAMLMYFYRRGGIVDGFNENTSLRDLDVWIQAGNKILNGFSPYTDPGHWMKSGSVTTTFYGIAGVLLPNSLLYLIAQGFTFLGIWMFIGVLFENNFQLQRKIFVLTSAASCFRENLVNIQLTGHILFLLSSGIYLLRKKQEYSYQIWAALCFVLAIDLKPNISVAFVVIFLISEKKLRILVPMLIMSTTLYCLLSLWTSTNLLFEWIRVLKLVSAGTETSNLFGSVSFWQSLNEFKWVNDRLNLLSTFTFLLLFGIAFLASRRNPRLGIYISICVPFLYSFFQYYSFTAIYILILGTAISRNDLALGGFIVTSLVITTNHDSMVNVLLLLVAVFTLTFHADKLPSSKQLNALGLGVATSILVKVCAFKLLADSPEQISAILTLVLFGVGFKYVYILLQRDWHAREKPLN